MYVTGFILSIALTLGAYLAVVNHMYMAATLVMIIIGLALVQFAVQLIFFLHLGTESKPRWRLMVFWLMVSIVVILVGGSIWIMNNLNYHMTPQQVNTYMNNQGGGF
jgi:cytochrome o ubiquinol oxidase operon protein cyoD